MSGILPSDLFSGSSFMGNDVLHVLLAALSLAVLAISAGAYLRRRDSRYFFLMVAFVFFFLDQAVTLYQVVYFYGFLITVPYLGLHLVHLLELLMLASLLAALLVPTRGVPR